MAEGTIRISLQGVHKSFSVRGPALHVLDGVDLYAAGGEFVSIIGPSGCGKSTLLNIIAGLEEPDAGAILINGEPVARRLGMLGYMHQKDLLLPWRTVLDNVILALEVKGDPRPRARRMAMELMERFGLGGFESYYPSYLSSGMRQRAAFLRTILADQELILLDEPFGALDALTRIHMQEWLLQIWESFRKTVVLITHDVDEAILLSDRVYVLTARPARVKMLQEIGLPRPRSYEMVTQDTFTQIKGHLLASLREETLRQVQEAGV